MKSNQTLSARYAWLSFRFGISITDQNISKVIGSYSAIFGIFNERTAARPDKYSDICKISDPKDVAFEAFCDEIEISFGLFYHFLIQSPILI